MAIEFVFAQWKRATSKSLIENEDYLVY